jgi:DNA-binding IclR family transcriptional regulator
MAAGWMEFTCSLDALDRQPRDSGLALGVRYTGQMRMDDSAGPSGGAAPALRRGLAVLRLLASRPTPVSAGAVARDLGLARSTTYELLNELAVAGFAVHLPAERRWGLGVSAFEIGTAYLRSEPLERIGRPILQRLAGTARATAHLGVLHGPETLYLAKEKAPGHSVTLVTDVGIRLPAALTATGLSILANLAPGQVRALFPDVGGFVDRTGRGPRSLPELRQALAPVGRRGWAQEDGQVTVGTASVAAAVFDHNAMPIAAIGITVSHQCPDAASRRPSCTFDDLIQPVLQSVAALTSAIGGRSPAIHQG